jgi:8-oxo-dGTP pyrophosphatase MutT (NUDIX family)
MLTQFSETELNRLTIQTVDCWERTSAYLEEREQVWAGQMEKVLARKGQMWNGEIYTFEDILTRGDEQIVMRMSTCEYKDLVFRFLKGQEYIAGRFGEAYLFRFTGVTCVPLTADGKYIFGIRADRPEQGAPIGVIGGTLNKDEMEIHSFADIRQCMLREIQEETALECPITHLRFFGLYFSSYSNQFRFTVRLSIHSQDINQYHRPGEFSSLIAYSQQEANETTLQTTRVFLHWRPDLHLLPYVLDGLNPIRFR